MQKNRFMEEKLGQTALCAVNKDFPAIFTKKNFFMMILK
jgi:hypothetical protein